MDGKTLARIGAVIFVAVAITATAIEMNRHDDRQNSVATQARTVTERYPLDAELARCSGLGEAGPRDPACLRAWADNRRRFLREPAPSVSPETATPTTLFPNGPAPADQGTPAVQPEPAQGTPLQNGSH
ncbi:putative entry exclusion protein TrbK-alt [Lichenihabitans psoromatis]|uniref:putative entry exclusion protein TrbK-alt n=1 Tax=Lichenihabitans psoromatis TaxID=2528642 RepID=UPI001036785C|nr:putative entry exclusion protein TrbK-alt [Lichenihabitans psoromatis]